MRETLVSNTPISDATGEHLDAEKMAAWADHGLSAEAASAVELHLSNCDRCQEVLAAIVRSEPSAGAVILPFWTRRPVQWSAAGLAAAAAVVAMIWIGQPPTVPTPESTIARSADSSTQPLPVPPGPPSPAAQRPAAQSLSATERKAENAAPPKRAEPAPFPPPPAATQPPVASLPVTVGAAAPAVRPVGSTAAANAQMAAKAESLRDAFSAVIPVIEIAAPEPTPAALRSVASGAGRGGGGGTGAFRLVSGSTRWRIVQGIRLERTLDAGATWAVLPIEPPLTTPLLAGAAASTSICWIVGREGVVLVTSDGVTFRRVSLPEAVHLTGVTASDGMRATVTAVDGRKFSTI
ncbi:MAG: zf-HC2 domain-containing protein, partial [Vicinamibacterales bacterium]